MASIWTSFLLLHIFVIFGGLAKYFFKDAINERGFVLVSIYFLQPLLIFWGILIRPIDWTIVAVPLIYLGVLCIATVLVIPLRFTTTDKKNKAILQITGIVSNTGNLGIPFGLLLYGPESVPYTAMINLANSIFVCTFGAYRYSRGTFPISKSFINVLKLPMIWSAGLAIFWQLMHWEFNQQLMQIFEMAAYSTMVLQLMIFGMFIATIQRNQLEIKNIVIVQLTKYLLLPVLMVVIIPTTSLPDLAAKCLLLQSIMPIAVNNMNLAALYNCYPQKVAIHAILSTAISLIIVPMIV